jgi:hypothetical protein
MNYTKHFLVLAVVLAASLTVGQDVQHAPTVAQCQADQTLWLSKVEGPSASLPAYYVIAQWGGEMKDCETVDPSNQLKYYNTMAEITAEEHGRLEHFVDRHGTWDIFIAEGGAGKR